jgi:hypothetical protein
VIRDLLDRPDRLDLMERQVSSLDLLDPLEHKVPLDLLELLDPLE